MMLKESSLLLEYLGFSYNFRCHPQNTIKMVADHQAVV